MNFWLYYKLVNVYSYKLFLQYLHTSTGWRLRPVQQSTWFLIFESKGINDPSVLPGRSLHSLVVGGTTEKQSVWYEFTETRCLCSGEL